MIGMRKPAPGEDQSVALAFVNTRFENSRGPVDELTDPEAGRRWLVGHAGAPRELELPPADLERVRALRDAIREVLSAVIKGRTADDAPLSVLAATTAAAPGSLRLTSHRGELVREWVVAAGSPLERALATIASDAIALTGDERRKNRAECGAPDCIRLLLRDHNRRHWCSTRCGDRVRATRYRERHRVRAVQPRI
jgi:predicted RNA-binding Zn ribbon-like protein